jgi:hypothetical protein
VVGLAVLAVVGLAGILLSPRWTQAAADPLTAAWERARAAGSYRFSSDVTEVSLPSATVGNVGRTSRTQQMYLEGQNDLRSKQMAFTLWAEGGSVLQAESGVSVRMEGGKTFARRGAGEWEVVDEVTGAFAPQGDFLNFLSAVKDVRALPQETRGGIAFTRYTFTLDSPRFAALMHQQMTEGLRARGELPPTVELEAPALFREMVGTGELWVGTDGLPLRQVLTLQFPPQDDEQVQAQIVVNFSDFGQAGIGAETAAAGGTGAITATGAAAGTGFGAAMASALGALGLDAKILAVGERDVAGAALVLVFVAGAVVLVYFRRTRLLRTGAIVLVIFTQVGGPLLSASVESKFFAVQAAKASDQEARREAANTQSDIREALGAVEFNPHQSPLERGAGGEEKRPRDRAEARFRQGPWDGGEGDLSAVAGAADVALAPMASDDGTDSDGDGLTNFAEERVGTSPANEDTDGDGLSDTLEVTGFSFGGQTWYTDPSVTDSNGDGLVDLLEWGANPDGSPRAVAQDSDGDGTPDLFDTDNDNDAVPDGKDLAPFAKGAGTYNDATPLALRLNNLTANVPTFVEFQLRPQDPKQLWFAYNVLDWPQDSLAQIRDVDNKTYADVAQAQGRTPDPSEANGDVKVIPMLEIRMSANGANLPPQSDLSPFNISVNNFTADGLTKVAYVPLSMVTDEKTGERVGFSAQMIYLPTGSWPNAHQVRLAWVVQALTDQPCDKEADTSPDCQADGYRNNVPQMIQTYYSDWSLTGLNVREDHGSSMAIVYEDPAVDDNKQDDKGLWALSHVLERHFTVARDTDNNGQRDLKLADLAPRFDHTNNPSASQRMDVPNILKVVTRSYTTQDQALASTTMTETAAILNNVFAPQVTNDRQIKPLLLFAQEDRSRQLSLSLLQAGGGYVTQNGGSLTLDMAPAGSAAQTVDTVAGIKWTGYCAAKTGPVNLKPCSDEVYWEDLERRYAALPSLPDDEQEAWVGARVQFAQLYYTGLRSGAYSVVQQGASIPQYLLPLQSESDTAAAVRGGLRGLSTVPVLAGMHFTFIFPTGLQGPEGVKITVFNYGAELRRQLQEAAADVRRADRGGYSSYGGYQGGDKGGLRAAQRQLLKAKARVLTFKIQVATAALSVLQIVFQVTSYIPGLPPVARGVLGALSIALNAGITVIIPSVMLFRSFTRLSVAQLFNGTATISRSMKVGGIVGAAIGVAATWGFFIWGAVESGFAVGSPELNRMAAEAIAATVVTILLTVLALNPVGLIISAVLGVIDFLLNLICELGVKDLQKVPGQEGTCFTLTGTITKYLTKLIYSYDVMVSLDRSDLMLTSAPQVTLADPSKGFVGGNSLSVGMSVTTTAVHKDPDPNNGVLIYPYMYLFSADSLKRSSFLYSLTPSADEKLPAALDQMPSLWRNVREDRKYLVSPMYRGELYTEPNRISGVALTPSLNQKIPLKLNMGYAVPAYECWLALVVPVCYLREFKGDNHMPIDALYYDVLPPTLEGFLALGSKGDGGLGQAWDPRFPSLRDADGDGLLSTAYNGLDPNDSAADGDGDGLTDRVEIEQRAGGAVISPIQRDTDADGLTDWQELQLGTDPGVADGDGDGLKDGEEVAHLKFDPDTGLPTTTWEGGWSVSINAATPFTVRVSSDPAGADGDADGISDLSERQLAADPNPLNRVDSQNRPYHPNLFNSPPLAVIVQTDDLDNIVGPGQSLRYTTTAIANTAMVAGVLNLNAPAFLGGPRNPTAVGFDPQTFVTAQSVTQGISLTVAAGTGTQRAPITSTVGTRLQDTGVAAWAFAPIVTEAPLGGFAAPNKAFYSDITPSRSDRQDSYNLAALAFDSLGPIGRGDILNYSIPGGAVRAIENDQSNRAAFMGNSAPSMASNAAGDTLAVWGQMRFCNTITFNSIRVVTAGADGDGTAGIEPIIALTPNAGTESIAWRWDTAGGTRMTSGQSRGPNAGGFPVTLTYCNGTANLTVYDEDGANKELVQTLLVDMFAPQNGVRTFTGAGHTIEVNTTVPLSDQYVIGGALLGPDGNVKQSISFPRSPVPNTYQAGSTGPSVASDGSGFLVAYESHALNSVGGTPGKPQIVVQAFDKDGNPLSSTYRDAGSTLNSDPQYNNVAIAAAWTGSGYRVAWQDRRASKVFQADAAADGSTLSAPAQIFGNAIAGAGRNYGPSVAYDPISGRTLVVFLSDFKRAIGLLYQGATQIGNPLVLSLTQFPEARSPQVAWHPNYGGWLLSYQDDTAPTRHVFVPVNSDGVQAFGATSGFFIDAKDNSLACPAPQSALAADLRFDELPGATTFADSSGRGNNATCTGASCPTAGLAGAPNDPTSDYSVQFDGANDFLTLNRTVQDDFTIAFWFKAPQTSGQQTLVESGDFNTNGFRLSLTNGGLVARVPGMGIQMQGRIDNGQWRHVAFSRTKSTGRIDVYVDGSRVIGIEGTPGTTLNGSSDIRIGMQRNNTLPLNAGLDGFQIFGGALGQDAVQGLINRTLQSYCVAGGTIDTAVYWAKVQASKPDVRGGRVSASGSLTLTVDADLPTAQITSVQNNELVGPAQVIGGTASDPTAGVLAVEVSINNGPWQAAQGSNTWAFSLAGQSGPISVRVRALDAVGNFGNPSAALNLTVDATAPSVTINALPQAIRPSKNPNGIWQVNLSGTASDANGIKPQSLLVRLEQQSNTGVAQTPQQAARSGNNWSIGYLLDPGLFDPTGAYTVTVGAEDLVGNRATPATAVLRLDVQGPNASLNSGDVARQVITQTVTIGGVVSDTQSIAGIDKLEIAFTPVEQVAKLPPGVTGEAADALLNRAWRAAVLAQRGAGVSQTTWSYQVPRGLENLFQMDLRATDMLGNVAISTNLWRGEIDTTNPRMVMTAQATGASYLDAGSRRLYAVRFLCAAADRNLNEASFQCPGRAVAEPVRSFSSIPELQTLFPDLTLRTGLAISYTLWMTSTTPSATVRACDSFGRCNRASVPATLTAGAADGASEGITEAAGGTAVLAAAEATDPATFGSGAEAAIEAMNEGQDLALLSLEAALADPELSAGGAEAQVSGETLAASLQVAAERPDAPLALPQAVVVSPSPNDVVAGGNTISVTVAAEASALLKTVTIRLDGNVVQTLDFAQADALTSVQRTVGVAVSSEGLHMLLAEATDWAGGTQTALFPVSFRLDKTPPVVTIDAGTLTNADTWQAQSGILRFNGTASDSLGLAAVQVRVDGGEWADATFGGGTWKTAIYVPDPEGRTLSVTARATDRAGRVTEVTQPVGTALSVADAPDTAISSGPPNPSGANTGSFVFGGSVSAAVFECSLDGGLYELCASPQQISDLSKGSHTLRVRAIDSRGFADLSPAAYTWTVNPSALNATITSKPSNPSTQRSATFAFTGNGGAFECSLDEGAYAPCTSPTTYAGLSEGEHSFKVRAVGAGNQRGTAESYTWTIANAAPQANDQSVSAGKNRATAITLTAVDDELLEFNILTFPSHGVLTGAAPDLVYTPDSDYLGTDSFTFRASNGAGAADTGTVTIAVEELKFDQKLYLPSISGETGPRAGAQDEGSGKAMPESAVKTYLPAVNK